MTLLDEPLDLSLGFVLICRWDGRLLATLERWDDAVDYVRRLHRGPAGRTVRVATYAAGYEGQFQVTSRWKVFLFGCPRKESWFSITNEMRRKQKGKNTWKQGDGGHEPQ